MGFPYPKPGVLRNTTKIACACYFCTPEILPWKSLGPVGYSYTPCLVMEYVYVYVCDVWDDHNKIILKLVVIHIKYNV